MTSQFIHGARRVGPMSQGPRRFHVSGHVNSDAVNTGMQTPVQGETLVGAESVIVLKFTRSVVP